ncbi:inositol monophosphatase family protein [Palleronia abyssalis]|uniref:Fructose-1, 6-bisphosphatase/inositol-1-monophosphatase n=1 Tax=Palleronia abyssalis TaxID=1501240 RepID=A0A2R8BXT0_9RHOB|nr:inositol monophosphatase [Palleronia abyssalis]SPJ24968.1 Fructose-1, 6-bisphosphatase/inositol-1-monophosphatase [Palleronia abyssalis]
MIDQTTEAAIVGAVRDVARTEILPRFRSLKPSEIDTKTGPEDLVTVADRAAEKALGIRLLDILPGAALVGEEAVEDDPSLLTALKGDGLSVVIDPIDGTWNFAHGLALFGVILAVRQGGRTIWGLLYDPVMDDWMVAAEGQGARFIRDGSVTPLHTRAPRAPQEETGYLPLGLFDGPIKQVLAGLMPRFSRVQSLRCSLHEYRMLAAGHVDWVMAAQSKPWDHLAGQLIVAEAGGAWGTLDGTPYDPGRADQVLLAACAESRLTTLRTTFQGG